LGVGLNEEDSEQLLSLGISSCRQVWEMTSSE